MDTSYKGRVLFLLNYLMQNTDEEHELTTSQLCHIYQEHGFNGYRKTVKNDANALQEAGFNVEINSLSGQTDTYCYLEKSDFDAAEIKLLLDAVASARFLSEEKCLHLTNKLLALTCATRSDIMTIEGRPPRMYKDANRIFPVIDVIEKSIESKHKITFQYYDYDLNLNKILHNSGEVYTYSPYSLKWNQDRYYLLGMVDKRPGKINPFRVDLICNIKIIDDPIVPPPADYIAADYTNHVFKMYGGPKTDVVMEASAKLIKEFVDRFGDTFKSEPISQDRFRATVTVAVSPTFFAWVFQYSGKINIISPQNVLEQYLNMLRKVISREKALTNTISQES